MDKDLFENIQNDLYRVIGRKENKLGFLKNLYKPEFCFLYFLRCYANAYKSKNALKKFFYLIMWRHFSIKYGYEIGPSYQVGKGLRLVHRGGIIVNPQAKIGDNCTLFKGCIIGSQRRGLNMGAPTIGNYVWIGANACIVGGVTIGDNVLIAPNSYVNFNVPANSIYVGNPAKIISRDDATEHYIDNPII